MSVPYSDPFLRVQVSGTHMGEEEWSYSFAIDGATRPTAVPPDAVTAIQTFHTTANLLRTEAKLRTIKVNEIGVDGKYTQQETVYHDFAEPGIGGAHSTGSPPPPQTALCVTLRTARRRGAGANGRFYLPLPAVGIDANTGQMALAVAQAAANAAGTMLTQVVTAIGGRLVVPSQGGQNAQPAHVPVVGVQVGRIYDTQRRRRADLLEAYVPSTSWAPPP